MSLNYQDNTSLFVTQLLDDYLYVKCLDELSLEYGLKLFFWSDLYKIFSGQSMQVWLTTDVYITYTSYTFHL